jgi:tape measure domain-containing protein
MDGGDISMSSIDSRVVQMKFDNAQFESGIRSTLGSLTALKTGLKLEGATKGLNDINAVASKGLNLSNISTGVDQIASKFTAMSVIAITALTNIVNKAVTAGLNLAKSLTIAPIMSGMTEYETKLTSIQTILANTQAAGTNLSQVSAALNDLNEYSDKTIYNFGEMAKNIGTFTAAGVDLETSVNSIKGIANLAALSGSNSQQASTAMYQLSQAISEGKVTLESWNSVTNAGMGGTIFKRNLVETAVAMGKLPASAVKLVGPMKNVTVNGKAFRDSIMAKPGKQSWLTSDVLTTSLATFTGDLKDADLAAQGFTASQIVAIQAQAQTAKKAATVVKTGTQLIGTLQESAQSGWAATWELILGDFNEAPKMWTNVNNVIGEMIGASAASRNALIGGWKEMGGRDLLIKGIGDAFKGLMSVLTPIKEAFRGIFPATTVTQLYAFTAGFAHFTEKLKIGSDTAFKIKRVFQGFFAILDIGRMVLVQVIGFFARLFGAVTSGASGGFLTTLAKIGDWFTGLRAAIRDGDGLTKFFSKLGDPIVIVIGVLKSFFGIIGKIFGGFANIDTSGFSGGIDALGKRLSPLGKIGEGIAKVWASIGGFMAAAAVTFAPLATAFSTFFSNVGKTIQESFGKIDYATVLDSINTGLLAGLIIMIKKFLGGGGKFGVEVSTDLTGGVLGSIKEAFGGLTETFTTMQQNLKAGTLMKIAIAIGILTLSVVALSMIDSAKLTKALTAISVMMVQLLAAMSVFSKIAGLKGAVQMPVIAAAMILFAVAIDILAIAVTKLAKLSWGELAKGLTGVVVLLGALVLASKGMETNSKGMIRSAAGLILMAIAIRLLVGAVTDLGALSWEELAKGLIGVGVILAALTFFTKFSGADKGGMAQGAGILLMAIGIKILASALTDLSALSWEEIGRGLVAMAGGLAIMAIALKLIPPSSLLSAAAVLVVAASLGMIADALGQMGSMSWEEIAKGLIVLAGSLLIIAVAMNAMTTAIFGAAALIVVAAALQILAPVLMTFGTMPWENIAKALIVLAGALAIIAIAVTAMILAGPGALALIVIAGALAVLTPVLLALGNMEWEAIGKGLFMLAAVFAVIGIAGLLLTPVIPTLLGFGIAVTLLGVGMLFAGAGLMLFATGLTILSVAGVAATAMVVGIVSGLIGLIPMLLTQIGLGIIAFAKVIATGGPAITNAITVVLLSLVTAIARLTPVIISTLVRMLFLLVDTLVKAIPRLVTAGMKLVTGILTGIAKNIGKIVTAAGNIIVNFLNALAKQLPRIVTAGVNVITSFIRGVANNLGKIIQAGANLIIKFINGLTTAINKNSAAIGEAGGRLGIAMVKGMASGLKAMGGVVVDAAKGVASRAFEAAKSFLKINSPSKKFHELGMGMDEGMANGVTDFSHLVSDETENVGRVAIETMRKSISGMADLVSGPIDIVPVITPIIDLSKVQKGAGLIGSLLAAQQISVGATYSTAKDASAGYQSNKTAVAQVVAQATPNDGMTFIQNNNSPKALSSAEIYRQTKNQLSVAKGALAT